MGRTHLVSGSEIRFVPSKGNSTVHNIATSGTAVDRNVLWDRLDDLRAAINRQAELSLDDAVSEYVEAVSRQRGRRLDVLLTVTGLNGQDPIISTEAARRLGVSRQRISQIIKQLHRRMENARPAKGSWLPQIETADQTHWPAAYTQRGIEAIQRGFLLHKATLSDGSTFG
jgi:uncharacterized protein (DUF58 family)